MDSVHDVARARREGVLFGIPLGDLGWFSSLLMGLATGFAAFFATTFVSIMALLFYRIASGHNPDFAIAYRDIGFPVGCVVLVLALGYLSILYVRRMRRRHARHS
jgi:ABC-type dipeptide/oligopeptide/nickel transport system permease subunit